jgi:hypothetical protein
MRNVLEMPGAINNVVFAFVSSVTVCPLDNCSLGRIFMDTIKE